MTGTDAEVVVIGGGVVGCAVAHALARRGVVSVVLEAEPGLALGASGTNSGLLHMGFDSPPGELETRLILRAAELREELATELGFPVGRCGALMTPLDDEGRTTVARLAANAAANGVPVQHLPRGALGIPGESITDPVRFTHALARAARAGGAHVRLEARASGLERAPRGLVTWLADGDRIVARAAVNCAGLHADEVARLARDEIASVYPRKGEFLVFRLAPEHTPEQILMPVPSALGRGVLVFPTLDGHTIAGPTAREREDKDDWSVEPDAQREIQQRAAALHPPLADAAPVDAYAGLRPAGRDANYLVLSSRTLPGLVHVAAIRSTGLTSSLALGEHVVELLAAGGVGLGPPRALPPPGSPPPAPGPWWQRAARHHESGT